MDERVAGPPARAARLGPGLSSAAAGRTGAPQRDFERQHDARPRLTRRKQDLRRQGICIGSLPEERLPDALDEVSHRWKVDRDLVGEAVARRAGAPDGVPE